ncbi:hypothetical protein TNCV_1781611 [Trichonephila clavipes]|nr:hypothetical protein TNCV_1781611 [Trichonephila clavipes]
MTQEGETASEALHTKKFCSRFLIRKTLYKVGVCSEYRLMPRKRRNAYQRVSEFDPGIIFAYLECGLLFRDIALRTGRDTTIIRIWN